MMRGYAIGLAAGTQMLTLMVGELIAGPPSEFSRALLMGAAWVINLAVAEWILRKRPAPPARTGICRCFPGAMSAASLQVTMGLYLFALLVNWSR